MVDLTSRTHDYPAGRTGRTWTSDFVNASFVAKRGTLRVDDAIESLAAPPPVNLGGRCGPFVLELQREDLTTRARRANARAGRRARFSYGRRTITSNFNPANRSVCRDCTTGAERDLCGSTLPLADVAANPPRGIRWTLPFGGITRLVSNRVLPAAADRRRFWASVRVGPSARPACRPVSVPNESAAVARRRRLPARAHGAHDRDGSDAVDAATRAGAIASTSA